MTLRPTADRCPGLLRTFAADDGAIVRLRLPGGRLAVRSLTVLMDAAAAHGAPFVQLTSRANLQVRGLSEPLAGEFVDTATDAGFLPHPTHERVRNLISSPWSTHREELAELVGELDEAVCADPELARLPGRWLMAVDDGSGHLLGLPYDVGYQRLTTDQGLLLIAGSRSRRVERRQAVAEIARLARDFVTLRGQLSPAPWTLAEVPPGQAIFAGFESVADPGRPEPPAGAWGADLVVTVPLGLLRPQHVAVVAELADEVVLTPWRRLVLPGAAGSAQVASRLADAGLVVTPDSGWDRLTACIGAPYCRRTSVPTLQLAQGISAAIGADETERAGEAGRAPAPAASAASAVAAKAAADRGNAGLTGVRAHLSGCERRCGRPSTTHVDLLAPAGVQEALAHLRGSTRV